MNIREWLKNPYNLTLIGIILLAFGIRAYFFFSTLNQPMWWDESEYLSLSNSWIIGMPYHEFPRPILFPASIFVCLLMGFGEDFVRFFLVVIPSTLLVLCVYYLGKEMFGEKIGLISAFFITVSWTLLFWTSRIQPDYISMCFQVLAVLFMWKHWKTMKLSYVILAGVFTALGLYFKISTFLIPMSFIVFIFIKERFSALTNKNNYIYSLAFILPMSPYIIYSLIKNGNMGFIAGAAYSANVFTYHPIAWHVFQFFRIVSDDTLFILFVVGFIVVSLKFIAGIDLIIREKEKALKPEIFCIVIIVVISAFYIFYIRSIEDRWVFLWLPFMFMLAGVAIRLVYQHTTKQFPDFKYIVYALLLLIIAAVAYENLAHANELVTVKEGTYGEVKDAALWLKESTAKNSIILTQSFPQTFYYSERNIKSLNDFENGSVLERFINETTAPLFLEISAFEQHPPWVYLWPNQNNSRTIKVYYHKGNPLLVVYDLRVK